MSTTLSAVPAFSNPPATPIQGWSNSFVNISNDKQTPLYAQASYLTNIRADGSLPVSFSKLQKDVVNKLKVSQAQNIYEADFEYGAQPLRWDNLATGTSTIRQNPQQGAVIMQINGLNDVTIRQSRPYHRYQPGKSMYMATAVNFGGATTGQVQRVGFFDDSNGIFFEQGNQNPIVNSAGMGVVVRSDIGGLPFDTRYESNVWTDPHGIASTLDWTKLQMLWMEYAWYGAGALRWGVLLNGEAYILHEVGTGNTYTQAWARTGNLPVRYEQRNYTAATPSTLTHYGVSVIIEGGRDNQRGFTYSYGTGNALRAIPAGSQRYPLLTIRNRTMGNIQYTGTATGAGINIGSAGGPLAFNTTGLPSQSLSGLQIYFPTLTGPGYPNGVTGRIWDSTSTRLTCVDVNLGLYQSNGTYPTPTYSYLSGIFVGGNGVTPTTPTATNPTYLNVANGTPYQIGLINRGQILPQELLLNSNANAYLEFFVSTPNNPIVLTNSNFVALSSLNSYNSFAERDITATSFTGGECVYGFWINGYNNPSALLASNPAQYQVQDKDLSFFFPLYNTIKGHLTDNLTLAVTVSSSTNGALFGANILSQEAMS
jgi:hypothetical protein